MSRAFSIFGYIGGYLGFFQNPCNRGKSGRLYLRMRTFVFFLYFWLTVACSSPIALILWVLDSAGLHAVRPLTGVLVRLWARSLIALLGVRVRTEGLERIPKGEPVCFVSNHQGNFDIAVILACLPGCVGFITKSQALWFPFLNLWILALGGVFLDRDRISKARQAMDKGVDRLRSGASMVVFPEGTRSRGPDMGEFHGGSFKLATRSGASIVPISIQGTYHIWEEKGSIVPASVTLKAGEPVPTRGLDPEGRKALPALVRDRIARALDSTERAG